MWVMISCRQGTITASQGGKEALLLFRGPLLGALVARVLVVCWR